MVSNETERSLLANVFLLGLTSINKLITLTFYIGVIISGYQSYAFGRKVSMENMYMKDIREIDGLYTSIPTVNNFLGITLGILMFVFLIVLLKIICELILLLYSVLQNQNRVLSKE